MFDIKIFGAEYRLIACCEVFSRQRHHRDDGKLLCDSSHLRNFDILFPCLVFLSEPDRGSRESYTLDGVWHLNPLSLDLVLCARCTVPPWEADLDLGTGDWSTPRPSHQNNQNYNWDLAPAPWRTSARLGGPKPRPF